MPGGCLQAALNTPVTTPGHWMQAGDQKWLGTEAGSRSCMDLCTGATEGHK
jgi:hypothetical protein